MDPVKRRLRLATVARDTRVVRGEQEGCAVEIFERLALTAR
jgi:hypothetical protein